MRVADPIASLPAEPVVTRGGFLVSLDGRDLARSCPGWASDGHTRPIAEADSLDGRSEGGAGRMGAMRSGSWVLLGVAVFVLMVFASAWAPAQPEMIHTGAACEIAPCGTLEDPERWRQAWWLWSIGALVTAVAAAFLLAPRRATWRRVLLLVVSAVLGVVPVAVLAYLLSLGTSVQGGATAAVWVPIAAVAVLGSWLRARRAGL